MKLPRRSSMQAELLIHLASGRPYKARSELRAEFPEWSSVQLADAISHMQRNGQLLRHADMKRPMRVRVPSDVRQAMVDRGWPVTGPADWAAPPLLPPVIVGPLDEAINKLLEKRSKLLSEVQGLEAAVAAIKAVQ